MAIQHDLGYCIIGAGASGLTVAKNFRQAGLKFTCFERQADLGGNWNYGSPVSSVYRSAHLISSKRLTQYTDFPMPDAYPHFPSQQQVIEYLRSYAQHFKLHEAIRFSCGIRRVEPQADMWRVIFDDGSERQFAGVVIANGHHWDPLRPEYLVASRANSCTRPSTRTPDVLVGRRVLVIGAGNSGCDNRRRIGPARRGNHSQRSPRISLLAKVSQRQAS